MHIATRIAMCLYKHFLMSLFSFFLGKLFNHMFDMLKYYLNFEIDDQSGNSLTDDSVNPRVRMACGVWVDGTG